MENYKLAKLYDRAGNLSKRWYISYYYRHPETNKFEEFKTWLSKTLLTRSSRYIEASRIKKQINDKLESGFNPYESEAKNYTFQQAFNEVLLIKAATVGSRTTTDYTSQCNAFLAWLKEKKYNDFKPAHFNYMKCQEFADHLSVNLKLSNRTRNNYIATLRTLFSEFKTRGIIDINHWESVKKLKVKETSLTSFTTSERNFISENLPEQHYPLYCVSLIIFYCYLRPTEITRLKICDFDFGKNQINVGGGKSKNGRTKPVIMHPHLVECLQNLNFNNYPADYFAFATSKLLLPNNKKAAGTRIADAWRIHVKKKYGITKHIYDLKATGAGVAFDSGIDARQIQLQIRHASLDETQKYLEKITNKPGQVFREKMPAF